MTSRRAPAVIRSPRAARALASPLRQEIVDAIAGAGPSTVAAIAAALDRRPDALYFHVRALERAGLVQRRGTHGRGRSQAAVYEVPMRPMRLDDGGTPSQRTARLWPALDALLRLARRDVRRALADPRTGNDGGARELRVGRVRGRVGPRDLARVNALLEECAAIIGSARGGPDDAPVALVFALTPIRAASRARRARSTRSPSSSSRRNA